MESKNTVILSEAASKVLVESPAAPVRVRLLREVLQRSSDDSEMITAVDALNESIHVQELTAEQHDDGSWGQFHTADSAAKQRFGTTEVGVQRALELGLSPDHPVLSKVRPYLEGILNGCIPFPDRAEKHENWPTGVALFTGAMLSAFAPESSALNTTWEFWSQVVQRSFSTGRYDKEAELASHRQLLGLSGKPTWMRLFSKPVVMILGSRVNRLPSNVEAAYVRWLWEDCPRGLVYLDVPLDSQPQHLRGWCLCAWLRLIELLTAFPSSRSKAEFVIKRLMAARNDDGLWDFGIQPSCPRLSDNYRRKGASIHDWTTRVTCLLKRFLD